MSIENNNLSEKNVSVESDNLEISWENTFNAIDKADKADKAIDKAEDPKPWQFLKFKESQDKKYMIYKYKLQFWWTPEGIRAQAVKQGIAKKKEWIQITNGAVNPYPENQKISANNVVFVRIPKSNLVEKKNENKPSKQEANNSAETTNEKPKWLRLENGTYIYNVQSWDTRGGLIDKLSKYKPLAYLKNWYTWQWVWSNSFNIWSALPDAKFQAWVDIIVPNKEKYEKPISEFKKAQLKALEQMKGNSKYGEKVKNLLKSTKEWWYWYSAQHIVNVMTAYAMCESSLWEKSNTIWTAALFRYEPTQVFSYWYHHILYANDWKQAFKNLNFNLWDSCNPVKSWMLFLAFIIEKRWNDYNKYFDMDNVTRWAKMYNGAWYKANEYDTKLKNNYLHAKGK